MGVGRNRMRMFAGCLVLLGLSVSPWAGGQAKAPNSSDQVLAHLSHVLRWSQRWESPDVYLARPGDQLYLENGRTLARQVVQLEFQSALAQAALIGEAPKPNGEAASGSQQSVDAQNVVNAKQRAGQQMRDLQAELDALNARIPNARAEDRPALTSQRDTVQGQLALAQALHDNLEKLTSFLRSTQSASGVANELSTKILALERGIPGSIAPQQNSKSDRKRGVTPQAPVVSNSQNTGLIGQLGQLFHYVQSLRTLSQLRDETTTLQTFTQQLRAPLLAALRATLQQGQVELADAGHQEAGQQAAGQVSAGKGSAAKGSRGQAAASSGQSGKPDATTAAPAGTPALPAVTGTPEQKRQAMAALVRHFQLLSNATLPLSQELILLNQSQANLNQLQTSLRHDYGSILRTLLLKAAGILIALGLIWLFSELWRRATFRYIRDARRRRQFLVLRRVVTGFCMFVVILLGFVSDFSSLATYAGLITAGVAVALQAVILSVAAYFFLVGRYGVKVGDRVTVVYNGANSVAGDVVDIGLVRFYMMELAGSGLDMQPTGRICVFPNSVLFQTNPLFKQMPGTEYTWREVALPLSPEADGQLAEKELLDVVNHVYSSYQPLLNRQHLSIETTMGIQMDTPKPYSRVRFAGAGIEVMVRYPIPLRQAVPLDDRMVVEVTQLLQKNPSIKLAAGASPDLRSPVKA